MYTEKDRQELQSFLGERVNLDPWDALEVVLWKEKGQLEVIYYEDNRPTSFGVSSENPKEEAIESLREILVKRFEEKTFPTESQTQPPNPS